MEPGRPTIRDVELALELNADDELKVTLHAEGQAPTVGNSGRGWDSAVRRVELWRKGDINVSQMTDLTRILGAALFPDAIKDAIEGLDRQRGEGRLRIWIKAADADLQGLPWEAAAASFRSPAGVPLAMAEGISVFRRSGTTRRERLELPAGADLEVKFLIGAGGGTRWNLPWIKGSDGLIGELRELAGLHIDPRPQVAVKDLHQVLTGGHVFHFSGHAVSDDNGGQSLVLREADGDGERAPVGNLGDPFGALPDLRLAVLAACSTGVVHPDHGGWSQIDVPVVIAMQRAITDDGAIEFTRALYRELSASGDIDLAMAAGRRALEAHGTYEAWTPVVYSSCRGGVLSLAATPDEAPDGEPARTKPAGRGRGRPLVRRFPEDGPQSALAEWLDGPFGQAVGLDAGHLRSITPFIGPGTLQTDPQHEQIRWDLSLDDAFVGDPDLGRFVLALREERVKARSLDRTRPEDPASLRVSLLRLRLAQLAERATAAFADAAREAAIPLNLWAEHAVPMGQGSDVLAALDAALVALAPVDGDEVPMHPLLGESLLRSRLEQLRARLGSGSGLTGSAVAWLTDLFWHAVIFDSPLYPHVEELSLQVSLLAGRRSRPIRQIEPTAAVVRKELATLRSFTAEAVERGYEASEPATSSRRRLYRALGDVLQADFGRWAARDPWVDDGVVPLALSSTFDLELERGLATTGRPYHVAIPIYTGVHRGRGRGPTGAAREEVEENVRWLVGRFDPVAEPTIEDLVQPVGHWRLASSLKAVNAIDLAGPVVVKLNGSPSHRLPEKDDDGRYDVDLPGFTIEARPVGKGGANFGQRRKKLDLEHAISLGEYDFLQLSRVSQWSFDRESSERSEADGTSSKNDDDGMAPWLVREICRPERYWMLLGHRYADWNSRTQIHTFIAHESGPGHRGCAVSLQFDQDRIRFLEWLGFTQATGPLAELVEPLQQVARAMRNDR